MQHSLLGVGDKAGARATEWAIGVDFGTAFSKAAATRMTFEHGAALREVRPLRLGQAAGRSDPFLAPSSMFLDRSRVHFGARAVERLVAADQDQRELVSSFKTILGASDFEHALNFYPRPCVDPDRLFRLRDLIVLYLAYLLALVDIAAAAEFGRSGEIIPTSRLRFTRPGWIPGRIAAAHEAMTALFAQAQAVRRSLGDALLHADGLDYRAARSALDAARANPNAFANLDGGIYEASAVGICHYQDPRAPNRLLIVDIGAGTTDVAGLERSPYGEGISVIRGTRRTIDVAGDNIDVALLELLQTNARKLKSTEERDALWRYLTPHVRSLKEELFAKGAVTVEFRGQRIRCTAAQLQKSRVFRNACREIQNVFEASLKGVIKSSKGQREIGIVLAGGGSCIGPIRAIITKKRWRGFGPKLVYVPATPKWAHELNSAEEFEALFAQLCAAFGAAISGADHASAPPQAEQARVRSAGTR